MSDKKQCPILISIVKQITGTLAPAKIPGQLEPAIQPQVGFGTLDCMEKECAWWDEFKGMCAILRIAKFMPDA